MQALQTLIDKASEVCGGQNALARELHVSKGLVSQMRNGTRSISPAIAAILADMANEDVTQAIEWATLASAKDSPLEYRLGEILGKAGAAGGGVGSQKYYSGRLNIRNECEMADREKCEITTGVINNAIHCVKYRSPPGRTEQPPGTAHRGGFFMPEPRTVPAILARVAQRANKGPAAPYPAPSAYRPALFALDGSPAVPQYQMA